MTKWDIKNHYLADAFQEIFYVLKPKNSGKKLWKYTTKKIMINIINYIKNIKYIPLDEDLKRGIKLLLKFADRAKYRAMRIEAGYPDPEEKGEVS